MANATQLPSTGEVRLRDVEEADLPIFYEHQRDPEGARMAAFIPRDHEEFMGHWSTRILADDTVWKKTVLVDGHVAGNLLSFEMSGEREVGYWIGRQYWGKGIATRALSLFLEQARGRPIYAHVAKGNVASIRVLEKCGFTMLREDVRPPSDRGDETPEFVLILES